MSVNVERELVRLEMMSVSQLRGRYAELFGEPTHSRHRQSLIRRILWRLQAVDRGFVAENALTAGVGLPANRFRNFDQRAAFYDQLKGELEAAPGVRAVGGISFLPFGGWSNSGFRIEGKTYAPDDFDRAEYAPVTPGYFSAMGIPLGAGRTFTESDRLGAPLVIVINRTMAERFWPDEDPIGKRIGQGTPENPRWSEVVGVVGDVKHHGLTEMRNRSLTAPTRNPTGHTL
ncbi:MAG: ABC transporter permease [Gemmatimonadetes bacterium]|nr:ABC transporter permease [Gemmatimonadota bacterium]